MAFQYLKSSVVNVFCNNNNIMIRQNIIILVGKALVTGEVIRDLFIDIYDL